MLKKIYRQLPYQYSFVIKKAFYFFLGTYYNILNLAKHKTTDMFNAVNIETTTHCNRRCSYCPNFVFERGLKQNEKLMPEQVFKKVIDDLAEINWAGKIHPHGFGEPLQDKRLASLLAYAHQKLPRAKIRIITNGDFLNVEALDKLYLAGVKNYVISLHGNKEDRQKRKAGIKKLQSYIKKTKKKIKIDSIEFKENTRFDTRTGLVEVGFKRYPTDIICLYPSNPLVIKYNGDVVLCCDDYWGQVVFGNVKIEGLMDIWQKPEFKKIRQGLKKKVYTLDICKKCLKSFQK